MMKRILVSAIIAAASINAYAESNVTLYGVIDQAVAVTKHKHEAAKVRIDDGIYAGSRFGIKGTEDLGNGNSVGFILEQGFYAESGDAAFEGKAFSRESLLQAKGKWGEVAFGRAGGLSSDCGTYTILHGSALWTSYYTDGNVAGII
jgi:predicted porin